MNLGMPPIVADPGQEPFATYGSADALKSQILLLLRDPEVVGALVDAVAAAQAKAPDLKSVLLPLLQDPEIIRAIAHAVDEARRQEWKRDCQT
jgi:hypothetical protein